MQPCHTPFPIWNQSVVPCPILTHAYRFLRRQVMWSGIPISWRIFHSLLWYTGFDVVNKAEVDFFSGTRLLFWWSRGCLFIFLILLFDTKKFLPLMQVKFQLHSILLRYLVFQHHLLLLGLSVPLSVILAMLVIIFSVYSKCYFCIFWFAPWLLYICLCLYHIPDDFSIFHIKKC